MNKFDDVLKAEDLKDIVNFLKACLADGKRLNKEPQEIAWDLTYLHASDLASKFYESKRYPALNHIMDASPNLETSNGSPQELEKMWIAIKQDIKELDGLVRAAS